MVQVQPCNSCDFISSQVMHVSHVASVTFIFLSLIFKKVKTFYIINLFIYIKFIIYIKLFMRQ